MAETEQNPQNEGYSLLNKTNEVEEFLKDKWLHLKQLFKGCKNQKDVSRQALSATNFKELSLTEDLFVGNIIKNYKLAYINFTNVHIFGLPKEVSSEISLNSEATQATLILHIPNIYITGNYSLSNVLKKASGPFRVDVNDGTYTEVGNVVVYNNKEVDVPSSTASFKYKKLISDFKNLGFFTQLLRNTIGGKLVNGEVLPLIINEIGFKVRSNFLSQLRQVFTSTSDHNVSGTATKIPESKLDELVKSTISAARVFLEKGGYSNIILDGPALTVQDKEFSVQIVKLNISGLCTFEVENINTTTTLNNAVRVDLNIKTGNLHSYADLILLGIQPDSSPFTAGFNIDHVTAHMAFEKELNSDEAEFKLVQLDVQIDKLIPILYSTYTKNESELVKTLLPQVLVPVINQRLTELTKSSIENFVATAKEEKQLEPRMSF